MSDGELLAVLQHHGVATRLLDVSKAPAEALFFAVNDHADRDGRLFCFYLHGDQDIDSVDLQKAGPLPWASVALGKKNAKASWTRRVALADPASLDPRMLAQRGVFLVGGLNKRYAGDSWTYGKKALSAAEIADVSTIRVNFVKNRVPTPNESYAATGWTIRVPSAWKRPLVKRLATVDQPITEDSMYPPVTELKRMAARLLRSWPAEVGE